MINNLKNQKEEMQQKLLRDDSENNSESGSFVSSNNNQISLNNKEIQNLKSENLKKIKEIKE